MKVLIIQTTILKLNNKYYIHQATKSLMDDLSSHGITPTISGMIIEATGELNNVSEVKDSELCIFQEHKGGWRWPICHILAGIKFLRYINQYDFFYIFTPGHYPLICGLVAALFRKKIGVYLRVGGIAFWLPYRLLYKASKFGFATGLGLTRRLSKYTKAQEVIPMLDIPESLASPPELPSGLNIVFVGRVTREKGADALLAAFSNDVIKKRQIHLHVVGKGDEGILKKMGTCDNITLHGVINNRSQLFALLKEADALCLPSHDEGFPRVIYEASYSECAILTTFVGSIASMMEDGENCLRLQVDNFNSIMERIVQIDDNHKLLEDLQTASKAFFEERFKDKNRSHGDQINEALGHI